MAKEIPLVEYKKEAFHLFENLLNKLKIDFVTILINLQIVQEPEPDEKKQVLNQLEIEISKS